VGWGDGMAINGWRTTGEYPIAGMYLTRRPGPSSLKQVPFAGTYLSDVSYALDNYVIPAVDTSGLIVWGTDAGRIESSGTAIGSTGRRRSHDPHDGRRHA
jgi:hypothetical protein